MAEHVHWRVSQRRVTVDVSWVSLEVVIALFGIRTSENKAAHKTTEFAIIYGLFALHNSLCQRTCTNGTLVVSTKEQGSIICFYFWIAAVSRCEYVQRSPEYVQNCGVVSPLLALS